jgi:hypothetical protein
MVMVWVVNGLIFNMVEFPTVLICVISEKNPQKSLGAAPTVELSMARKSANIFRSLFY